MVGEQEVKDKKSKGILTSQQILAELASGLYANQIAKKYGVTKQAVSYHVIKLKKAGMIEERGRDAYKLIKITKRGESSLPEKSNIFRSRMTKAPIRLHAMQLSMNIMKESPESANMVWDKVNTKLKNWLPQYKFLPSGIGMTLQRNARAKEPKIIIHLHKRDVEGHEDTYNILMRASHAAAMYLRQYGIECDVLSATRTYSQFAVEDEAAREMVKKKMTVTVGLGRDTTPILPMDKPKEARAWVDASEGHPEIESNDLEYAVRYIKMPELVAQTAENLNELSGRMAGYAEHLNAHVPVLIELKPAIQEMRAAMQELRDMVKVMTEQARKPMEK